MYYIIIINYIYALILMYYTDKQYDEYINKSYNINDKEKNIIKHITFILLLIPGFALLCFISSLIKKII
jgi:hypothetical protein